MSKIFIQKINIEVLKKIKLCASVYGVVLNIDISPALLASGFLVTLSILSHLMSSYNDDIKFFSKTNSKVVVVETHYDDLKCLVRRENLTQAMQEI